MSQILESLRALAVPVESLVMDPANARTHDSRNIDSIKASLAKFGQRKPIVVQRQGMVVRAGNGTLTAAKALGWTEIAAVIVDEGDVEATAYAIADNRTAELARWDEGVLGKLLRGLDESGFGTGMTGFTAAEVARLRGLSSGLTDPDDAPPAPAVATTKPGDLYLLGEHRLLCGDSERPEDVARLLDGEKPWLMVTDPPYGVNYDPTWRVDAGVGSAGAARGKVANDDRADWTAAWRLFPGSVAYVWHGALHAAVVAESLIACGFDVRAQIVWVKTRPALSRGHYHWQHEPAFYGVRDGSEDRWRFNEEHELVEYAVRGGASAAWQGGRKQSTVWSIDHLKNDTGHGTQKPVECMARPMRNHGAPGDLVYDPFLGSGTSIIAAQGTGRRCFGMELDPVYCDVIVTRWEAFTGQKAERRPA